MNPTSQFVFDNINFLLKEKGMKKADLETQAGFSAGYLSRIKNSDRSSLPSIEFLNAACSILDVDLFTLMECDLRKENSSEHFTRILIQKLIQDTKASKIFWMTNHVDDELAYLKSKETDRFFYKKNVRIRLEKVTDDTKEQPGEDNSKCTVERLGFLPLRNMQQNSWLPSKKNRYLDDFFSIAWFHGKTSLVLITVHDPDGNRKTNREPYSFKQLWMIGEESDLLCDQSMAPEFQKVLLQQLADAIADASIHISPTNKAILDKYLNGQPKNS